MTIGQKNKMLLVGFIVVLLIAYQFSFKKTFELNETRNDLSKEQALIENANERIQYLQQENTYLDGILKSNEVSANQSFEQNLFQKLQKLNKEHKTKIVSFEKPHKNEIDGATMLSYTIELKGSYRNLMLFASSFEKQRIGRFSLVEFIKKRNSRTRRNELICKIILQKLSK